MARNAVFYLMTENGTYPPFDFIKKTIPNQSLGLRMESGSWVTTDMGDGTTMEVFNIFCTDEPEEIMTDIRLIQNYFELAHKLNISNNPNERTLIYTRNQNEVKARIATFLGGTITPLTDNVVTRELKRSAARYAITILRRSLWEHATQIAYSKYVSAHGGTLTMPTKFNSGTQDGRIRLLRVTPTGNSRMKRFWVGIKEARTTLDGIFDPEIRLRGPGYGGVHVNTNIGAWAPDTSDFGFIDDYAFKVRWGSTVQWERVLHTWFRDWNDSTGYSNSQAYHGKYHLLLRYRTSPDQGETYAIRAGYGWYDDYDANKLDPVYVSSTDENCRYVDLGVINLAADGFSPEVLARVAPNDFAISIHAKVIDYVTDLFEDVNASYLYIDNMYLIPADHFLHVEFNSQVGGQGYSNRRGEVYTLDSGSSYGYVVARDDTDDIGGDIKYQRSVLDIAGTVDTESWGMPTAEGSVLVFVSDTDGSTLTLNANVLLGLNVAARTVGV